ncbi:MAG: DUF4105 domain-containing protein [Stenotrophomonas sp.]|uniref:DUF7844 domain-containing protein n=1 Tax=Stenotrophomonas sp. TaxID=69392 RepID=UPI001355CE99|nr:DUF4105 domain-containing protein [Stenotrophomonas sp.]MTI74823.1 DUF4105 domain-containing protein [Stenotrophomonas sp.]
MRLAAVLAAALLLASGGAPALELALDPAGLDPPAQQRARDLLARAHERLPGRWQADPRRLTLRFDPGLPADIAGRHRRGQLRLSPQLLEAAATATATAHDLARATVLHEIAHAFDRGEGGGWSRQPAFRRLAGWDRRGANPYTLRSPDGYERHSPAEAFAVNLEWYLLDPRYPCRRPALAAWFRQQLGPAPLAPVACAAALPLLVAGAAPAQLELEALDPARIYAVDYLLAGAGDAAMSRFGHSMLRLVVCAPGREPGPRCRMDLAYHRVLSFRAFVNDVQISNWRGLTGAYPARLFVLPLDQVIDEYTRIELRDLQAWPLALSPAQIDALLQLAARAHWSYDGRYRFIGNNCAMESGRLLDLALTPPRRRLQATTPRGVLRRLQDAGLAARQAPPPGADDGLYFASARADYAHLLHGLQQAGRMPPLPLERWLDSPARQRGEPTPDLPLQATAAWWVLETAALRRAELRALAQLKRHLEGTTPQLQARVADWQRFSSLLDAPASLLPAAGYGIAQPDELDALVQALARLGEDGQARWQALHESAEQALPPAQREELERSRERVRWLAERMRALAAVPD